MLIGPLLAILSINSFAGLLRIESNTFFAKRTGDDLKSESPLFEEFQTTYVGQENQLKFDFDFGYTYDFNKALYNLDLNQLNFQSDIPKTDVHVSAGRTFETYHLIKSSTVDSVAVDYKLFNNQLKTGVLFGLLRNYEFDKYTGKAPVYTWYGDFKTAERYPITVGLKFEDADYSDFARSKYQTAKISLKKELQNAEVYGNYQKALTFGSSFRKTLGLNFYPAYDWNYGLEVQEYQKNKMEGFEQSIFNTFSLGKMRELTTSLGHAFSSKFYSGLSLSYDEYPLQINEKTTGEKIDWNTNFRTQSLGIKTDVFYLKSFGGNAYGYNVNGQYSYNDFIDLLMENEWVKYQKITSEKNKAGMIRFGAGTHAIAPFRIQALGEVSSNNYYSEEWAFLLRLTIADWREI